MLIGAYNKCSMLDYEGYIAAVVFTKGCNMSCPYCHNEALVYQKEMISADLIYNHLYKRKGMLDGIVISGGEPTMHRDLPEFMEKIKKLGYKVKLDTNGTNPGVLKEIIHEGLVDHIAMDIKGPSYKYKEISGMAFDTVKDAIGVIRSFGHYEFRTTLYPKLTIEDIEGLCSLYGCDPYYLQQYRTTGVFDMVPYEDSLILDIAGRYNVKTRGFAANYLVTAG